MFQENLCGYKVLTHLSNVGAVGVARDGDEAAGVAHEAGHLALLLRVAELHHELDHAAAHPVRGEPRHVGQDDGVQRTQLRTRQHRDELLDHWRQSSKNNIQLFNR